jgi:hypothetical protein
MKDKMMANSVINNSNVVLTKADEQFTIMRIDRYCRYLAYLQRSIIKIKKTLTDMVRNSEANSQEISDIKAPLAKMSEDHKTFKSRINDAVSVLSGDIILTTPPYILSCYLGTPDNSIETAVYSSSSWTKFLKNAGKEAHRLWEGKNENDHSTPIITIHIEGRELMVCGFGVDADGKLYEYLGQGMYEVRPLTINRLMRYCSYSVCNSLTIQEELKLLKEQNKTEGRNVGLYTGVM